MYRYFLMLAFSLLLTCCKKSESPAPVIEKRFNTNLSFYLRGQYGEELPFLAPINIKVKGADTVFELLAHNRNLEITGLKAGKYKIICSKEAFGTTEFAFETDQSSNGQYLNLNIPLVSDSRVNDFSVSTEHILDKRLILRLNGVLANNEDKDEPLRKNRKIRIFYHTSPGVSETNYLFTNITAAGYFGSESVTFVPTEIQEEFHLQKGTKLYAIAMGDNVYLSPIFTTEKINTAYLSSARSNVYEYEIE